MKFSLNFIQEFLKIDVSPQKLASLLTMAGMEVECLERVERDWIYDIEVTSNRYDWLSILGITREIAAILGKNLKVKYPLVEKKPILKEKDIIIEDTRDCPYYIGRMIKGIKVGEVTKRIKERVVNCGIGSINDIVDITNYCMLKWGNPLHAFDADKIEGDIYIRRARNNESFIGIDGKERHLVKDNLAIADDKKVIALAGIMGAKNSEVDENTKNIFLEAAIFSPLMVRRSRRIAGLDTESSYRFERSVSAEILEYASSEAAKLIIEITSGVPSGYQAAGKKPHSSTRQIAIDTEHLNSYLGGSFSNLKIKKILKSLGFGIKDVSSNKMVVMPSAFRFDIKERVDVYEEFSRIYGYEKINPQIPFLTHCLREDLVQEAVNNSYHFKSKLAEFISTLGFKEIITYSIEDEDSLRKIADKDIVKLLNPLRKQENALRTNLLLGTIQTIKYNLNRNQSSLHFFEIADIYSNEKKGFLEKPSLALSVSGSLQNLFCLKGAIEKIFSYLNMNNFEFRQEHLKNFTNALTIIINGTLAGYLGKLDNELRKSFDLKENVFFAQLDLSLLQANIGERKYEKFSPYPAIWRDISLCLKKDIKFKELEAIIEESNAYLAGLKIVDVYEGRDVPSGSKAFTLRIFYQSKNKTLTSQEVDAFHNKVRDKLIQKEGIVLR